MILCAPGCRLQALPGTYRDVEFTVPREITDGIIIEVHPDPPSAVSDGAQSLTPDQYDALVVELETIAGAIGRSIPRMPELVAGS